VSAVSREFLMVVKESAFKTPKSTPVVWTQSTTYGLANADAYYVRLPGDNQFTMRPRPVIVRTPYGGGVAIDAYAVSDKIECKGRITMPLYVSQAPFWLSWAGVRVSGSGTAPWTTTEVDGDLPSCAIYHGIQHFDDNSIKRRLYLGCKVDSWSIACSEGSTVATLTLEVSGSTPQGNQFDSSTDPDATAFPVPTDVQLAIDPYEWIHTHGITTIGGTSRLAITELNISSQNVLARSFYNNRFIQYLRWLGRKTTIGTRLQYLSTPDDRTHYEGLASEGVSVAFNNGTHGFVMDLKAQNIFDPLDEDLKLADTYWFTNTSTNMWDPSASADFALSFS
jgi:Phage tail tube protein